MDCLNGQQYFCLVLPSSLILPSLLIDNPHYFQNEFALQIGYYLGMSWCGRIGEKYGMNWKIASVSGATVKYTSVNGSPLPYIKNQLTDGTFDYVIVDGGINDAMRGNALGKISNSFKAEDFDTSTFAGSFEELLSAVKSKYRTLRWGISLQCR